MRGLIEQESTNTIMAVPQTTSSTISIATPLDFQVGNTPLSGKFMVKCVTEEGAEYYTEELNYNAGEAHIENAINNACPPFREAVRLFNYNSYNNR